MNQSVKRSTHLTNALRALIIQKVEDAGESISKVSADLLVNRTTINAILKIYRTTGRIEKATGRGHPVNKISTEIGEFIEKHVETNPGITLDMIKSKCLNEWNLSLSIPTIRLYLRALKVTLKRSRIILDRVNDPIRLELRNKFATDFLTKASMDDRKNVFVDESGFNLHMRRNYGRSKRGSRVNFTVPTVRGRNVSFLSAINGIGVIHFKIFVSGCKSNQFSEFVKELDDILIRDHNISDGCIYMDNCSIHRSKESREAMDNLVNKTAYMSPYSYMLNPIEFSFSKIKNIVRQNLGLADTDLNVLIPMASAKITPQDCKGWYRLIRRHCALAMQNHQFK